MKRRTLIPLVVALLVPAVLTASMANAANVLFTDIELASGNPLSKGGITLTTTTAGGSISFIGQGTFTGLYIGAGNAKGTYSLNFSQSISSIEIVFDALSAQGTPPPETISDFATNNGPVKIAYTNLLNTAFDGARVTSESTLQSPDGRGIIKFEGPQFTTFSFRHDQGAQAGFVIERVTVTTAGGDKVSLSKQGAQTALWVNGRVGGQQWIYKTIAPTATDPIDLGANVQLSDKDFGNQIVAFSDGRPPTLVPNVVWSDQSDTQPVAFRPSSEIEIKVWIISGNKTRVQVQKEIDYAARVWRKERLGFVLKNGGITDARAKLVGAPSKPAAQVFDKFSCDDLGEITGAVLPPGPAESVIHVFYVGQIPGKKKGSTVLGRVCETGGQYTAIAEKAPDDTLAHELGHNLSLLHTCVGAPNGCVTPRKALPNFDLSNVMMQYSKNVQRKYLTEGQTFRMNFDTDSALETVYGVAGAGARTCEKLQAADTADCPALHKRIWSDGKLGASP